ncbi:MAG: hypothetical protein H0U31_09875, partial [Chloroflexia bacterium]|nr:hypothetical protein [Chloroflexia bacterium]
MTIATELDLEELKQRAARYFDRPSFSMPAFIDNHTIAILDDRTGVPQLSLVDIAKDHVDSVTSFNERLQSLFACASGAVVFGMDTGGDERQQIWTIPQTGDKPRKLTDRLDAIHEPGVVSADGRFALVKSNARDESTFDVV